MTRETMNDQTKEQFLEKLKSAPVIEMVLMINQDLVKKFTGYFESQKVIFEGKLNDRVGKTEKLEFLKAEIQKHRDAIETDVISNVYTMFTQVRPQFLENTTNYADSLNAMVDFLPKEKEFDKVRTPEFKASLSKLTSLDSNVSLEELGDFLNQLPQFESASPSIVEAFKSKDPTTMIFTVLIAVHFEKQYIKHLLSLYDNLENGEPASIQLRNSETEKIEWLGTQKQLGELFVELHRKGWIKEFNTNTIQACFTKTDTLKQIAKPYFDTKENKAMYSEIFTKAYKPKFDQIKENTPKEK